MYPQLTINKPPKFTWICDSCGGATITDLPTITGYVVEIEGKKLILLCPECQAKK